MLAESDSSEVCERSHEADRAVPTHTERTDVVEENDAADAGRIGGWNQQPADENIRPARLVHRERTKAIVLFAKPQATFRHTPLAQLWTTRNHNPRRLATGVRIDSQHFARKRHRGSRLKSGCWRTDSHSLQKIY